MLGCHIRQYQDGLLIHGQGNLDFLFIFIFLKVKRRLHSLLCKCEVSIAHFSVLGITVVFDLCSCSFSGCYDS